MRVLVTGGAGFIGSCLVSELLSGDNEVLVYDNFFIGKREFLPADDSHLDVVEGDIVDHDRLLTIVRDWMPTVVIHLAALHYIPYCNAHPMETLRVNVEGVQSVLTACRGVGVDRIVFASSAAVYGISDDANRESDTPAPTDVYGMSKWFGETLLNRYHQDTGISCVAARLFNVHGYNETNPHVIPAILEQVANADEIQLGNLEPSRDFVFVKDVAHALIALAGAKGLSFGVFNVGTGQEYSIRELVHTVGTIVGRPLEIHSVASRRRSTDRWHLLADISRITDVVGWQPQYDLRSGLVETLVAMDIISKKDPCEHALPVGFSL